RLCPASAPHIESGTYRFESVQQIIFHSLGGSRLYRIPLRRFLDEHSVVRELISLAIDLLYSGGHHAILEEITSLAFCIFHPAAVYTVTVFHVIILAIHFQIALHHTNTGLLIVITEFILPELCPALDHLAVSLFILTEPARIALGIFHLADTHLAGRL